MEKYREAAGRLKQREFFIQQAVNELESELEFLGVTGVEDKL